MGSIPGQGTKILHAARRDHTHTKKVREVLKALRIGTETFQMAGGKNRGSYKFPEGGEESHKGRSGS